MPWNRPTLEQLAQRISADFSGRLLGGGAVSDPLRRSAAELLDRARAYRTGR